MQRRQTEAERVLHEVRLETPQPMRSAANEAPMPGAVQLALAALGWLLGVWAICYVGLQLFAILLGFRSRFAHPIEAGVAWLTASLVVAFALLSWRPNIPPDTRRDPVISAAAGGLLVWALASNTLPVFRPFNHFGTGEFVWFVGQNIVEMFLLAVVWASLTRRPLLAFGLGAGFQVLVTGISALLLAL